MANKESYILETERDREIKDKNYINDSRYY